MNNISEALQNTFNNVMTLQTNVCERNFKSVTIPNTVKNVGAYAFAGCNNLTNVEFKSKVDSIAPTAFLDCENLQTINTHWKRNEVSGAPWGAADENIVIKYLLNIENVDLAIERIDKIPIMAPTGHDSSVTVYIDKYYNGDAYSIDLVIEASSPTIYFYEIDLSQEFSSNYKQVNLSYNSIDEKYIYRENIGDDGPDANIEWYINKLLSESYKNTIEQFIAKNIEHNYGFNVPFIFNPLFDMTSVLDTVGYTYVYNVSLSGNLPQEELTTKLIYKETNEFIEGMMGNTCQEEFSIACYETIMWDEDIVYADFIQNPFLKFAFTKARSLLGSNYYGDPLKDIFEIEYE